MKRQVMFKQKKMSFTDCLFDNDIKVPGYVWKQKCLYRCINPAAKQITFMEICPRLKNTTEAVIGGTQVRLLVDP